MWKVCWQLGNQFLKYIFFKSKSQALCTIVSFVKIGRDLKEAQAGLNYIDSKDIDGVDQIYNFIPF